ncbi:hypothetical protein pb186bvf_003513 [Paramecium bursaria]
MGLSNRENIKQIKQEGKQNEKDDEEEVLEIKFIEDAQEYKQISNGLKTILISADDQYKKFNLPYSSIISEKIIEDNDLIIIDQQDQELIREAITLFQKIQKHHIFWIIQSIEQFNNNKEFPLQSKNQFKFEEIKRQSKQLALIHYNNYQNRIDKIQSFQEINQEGHFIRNNAIRLSCLWREILFNAGKLPKYGA